MSGEKRPVIGLTIEEPRTLADVLTVRAFLDDTR